MSRQLSILAPVRYNWRFNSPRQSRHKITIRTFAPLNRISSKIEGITVFNPIPPVRFHLIHAFNRIPISTLPFVIGFESHLPRGFGMEGSTFFRLMTKRLADEKCRAIVAISAFARRNFLRTHEGSPYYDQLKRKLHVRFPNVSIEDADDAFPNFPEEPIRCLFVGDHFGRKGGCVTLRMAELATERKLPIVFDVVSKFEVGAISWTDPLTPGYFDRYRKLLSLPNVRYHGRLPNNSVLELAGRAHFVILTTFSDTFGFSAIESMANYTPVIANAQGALPEFIQDGLNGILLDLETDEFGEWVHIREDRRTSAFAKMHNQENERLALAALDRIDQVLSSKNTFENMRRNARTTAEGLFAADSARRYWDDLYARAADGVVDSNAPIEGAQFGKVLSLSNSIT